MTDCSNIRFDLVSVTVKICKCTKWTKLTACMHCLLILWPAFDRNYIKYTTQCLLLIMLFNGFHPFHYMGYSMIEFLSVMTSSVRV